MKKSPENKIARTRADDYEIEDFVRRLYEEGFARICGVVMDVHVIRKFCGPFLRPRLSVVSRLLNPLRLQAIVDEVLAADSIRVPDQRSVAKSWWARGVVRRERAAFDHFSLCDGPTIESSTISQLLETGPKSDDADDAGERGGKDSFHKESFGRD